MHMETTSTLETVHPAVPHSYQEPRPASQGGLEQNTLPQAPPLPSLTSHSLPIAIEMRENENGTTAVNTGQPSLIIDNRYSRQRPVQQEPKPENHMTLGFLSTLFCACPCGLMSLCHAIQVNSDYYHGNRVGAIYNSQQAWRWGFASVVLGSLCLLIVIMYYLILMAIHIS